MTTTQYFIQLGTICAIPLTGVICYYRGTTAQERQDKKEWKAKRAREPRAHRAEPQKRKFITAFLRFRV
jgi:hypothetical protein